MKDLLHRHESPALLAYNREAEGESLKETSECACEKSVVKVGGGESAHSSIKMRLRISEQHMKGILFLHQKLGELEGKEEGPVCV